MTGERDGRALSTVREQNYQRLKAQEAFCAENVENVRTVPTETLPRPIPRLLTEHNREIKEELSETTIPPPFTTSARSKPTALSTDLDPH